MTKRDDKRVPALRFKGFTDEWEQRKLKNLVDFYSGLTYHPENIREKGTFVIRSSNIKDGQLVTGDNIFVAPEIVNSTYVKKDDIIVVVRNGSRKLIGKHTKLNFNLNNAVIGAFMTGIRSNNNNFINAIFDSDNFKREIHKNLGATINQITTGELKRMNFYIPSLTSEQNYLGNLMKVLDKLITLQQRKLRQLNFIRQGLTQNLFPDKDKIKPKVQFKGYKENWKITKAKNIFTEVDVRELPDRVILSTTQTGKVVTRSSLGRNLLFSKDKLKNYKLVLPGQFIIHLRSFKGGFATSELSGIVSPTYTIFDFKDRKQNDSNFWSILFTHYNFIQSLKSITEGIRYNGVTIKFNQFADLKITYPDLEIQSRLSQLIQCLDADIKKQKLKIQKFKKVKQFLLQNMFI